MTQHQVRVHFAGIVTIGPARPTAAPPPYTRVGPFFAIFPGSSRRRAVHPPLNGGPPAHIPFHLPAILTKAAVTNDSRQADEPSPEDTHGYNIWYPFRERLEFVVDGSREPSNVTYQHQETKHLKDGDFDLIADMREIWQENATMPKKAVSPDVKATRVPLSISGQVFIPGGMVSSCLGKKKERVFVEFHPSRRVPGRPLRRWIVSEAVVTFTAHSISILTTSMDTGQVLDSIIFCDLTHDIDIRIENADPLDIRKDIAGNESDKSQGADFDFELYYSVLAPKEKKDLPVPIDRSDSRLIHDCYIVAADRNDG